MAKESTTYFVDTSAGPRIVQATDMKAVRRYIVDTYLKSIRRATANDVLRLKDMEGFAVETVDPDVLLQTGTADQKPAE